MSNELTTEQKLDLMKKILETMKPEIGLLDSIERLREMFKTCVELVQTS